MCVHNIQHEDTWEILIAKVLFMPVVHFFLKFILCFTSKKKKIKGTHLSSPVFLANEVSRNLKRENIFCYHVSSLHWYIL